MATEIKMPDLGTTVDSVTLLKWLKQEGDPVQRGESLCEVETDKAVSELESVGQGILLRQLVTEGTEIASGETIAYVGKPGESAPEAKAESPKKAESTSEKPVSAKAAGALKVPPLIRNLAKREGVDLATVTPTGPGGKITREDVMRAKGSPAPAAAPTTAGALSANQRAVAKRISQSHREIVTISLNGRIEMSAAIRLRGQLKESGHKVSYDAIFLFAVSRSLKAFPRFGCHLVGQEELAVADGMHLGLAVSIGEELYTPTIRDPASKSVVEIDSEVQSLIPKAREGRLSLAEMTGACLTVSNLGMYPVRSFNVIIPPGQSAALAIGAIEETILIVDGKIRSEPVACVTLSVDHRVINGRQAGEFLAALKEFMEKL